MYSSLTSTTERLPLINLIGKLRQELPVTKSRNCSKIQSKKITHISYIYFSKFNSFATSGARALKPSNIDLADQKP